MYGFVGDNTGNYRASKSYAVIFASSSIAVIRVDAENRDPRFWTLEHQKLEAAEKFLWLCWFVSELALAVLWTVSLTTLPLLERLDILPCPTQSQPLNIFTYANWCLKLEMTRATPPSKSRLHSQRPGTRNLVCHFDNDPQHFQFF